MLIIYNCLGSRILEGEFISLIKEGKMKMIIISFLNIKYDLIKHIKSLRAYKTSSNLINQLVFYFIH
jgi:hypothetical protein